MSQFELLRNVTIGQYIPTESAVHRLDPRTKIVAASLFIFAVSFSRMVVPCAFLLICSLLIAKASKVPIDYVLRGIRLALPLLIFVFAVQFLFQGWTEPSEKVYFEWWWLRVTRFSVFIISIGILRILGFVFITSLITMTSTTTELTHGIEKLLNPFRRFRVPSHELALVIMIALRFVPTFAEEMERVMKAQASRCGQVLSDTKFWRPDIAARAYLPLIVPLFMTAFRRAEELVLAMEARCYISGDGRTKFIQLESTNRDYAVMAGSVLFFIMVVTLPWPSVLALMEFVGLGGIL
jgi:energy-coupling factor transport system permease protein